MVLYRCMAIQCCMAMYCAVWLYGSKRSAGQCESHVLSEIHRKYRKYTPKKYIESYINSYITVRLYAYIHATRPTNERASMAADVPSFLAEHELSQYAAAFEDNGWDSITALRDISDADLEVLEKDVAMKSGHRSRLRRALGKVAAPAPPAALPAPPAPPPPVAHAAYVVGVIRLRWLWCALWHGASSGVPYMSKRRQRHRQNGAGRPRGTTRDRPGVDRTQRMASSLGHFSGVRGRIDTVEVAMVVFVAWRV